MNKIFLTLIFCMFCLASCVTTKVSATNNFDYSVLQNNTNYIIEKKDGEKLRKFQFIEASQDKIIGKQNGKDVEINKNTITKIKKPSTGKTVGLVAGSVALFFIASAIPAAAAGN